MLFLPYTNTVILLEPYYGTITEPGLPVTEVENKRHFQAESQSTASHLFARMRSFHRPTFTRPEFFFLLALRYNVLNLNFKHHLAVFFITVKVLDRFL